MPVRLPQVLDRAGAVFRDFYLSKYSGRRLVWQHSLGSCMLRASFPKGMKELSVSTFQVRGRELEGEGACGDVAALRAGTGRNALCAGFFASTPCTLGMAPSPDGKHCALLCNAARPCVKSSLSYAVLVPALPPAGCGVDVVQ